jgi:hypothetical protein
MGTCPKKFVAAVSSRVRIVWALPLTVRLPWILFNVCAAGATLTVLMVGPVLTVVATPAAVLSMS